MPLLLLGRPRCPVTRKRLRTLFVSCILIRLARSAAAQRAGAPSGRGHHMQGLANGVIFPSMPEPAGRSQPCASGSKCFTTFFRILHLLGMIESALAATCAGHYRRFAELGGQLAPIYFAEVLARPSPVSDASVGSEERGCVKSRLRTIFSRHPQVHVCSASPRLHAR